MLHSWPGESPGESLDLPKRQEAIVSGCARRGDSEHRLNELQRWVRAVVISAGMRDGHETLRLLLQPPRSLCASTGYYPHLPSWDPCSPPLPGYRDPGTTSLGEHTARLRLLQCHASCCRRKLAPHSIPFPLLWPE